MEEKRWGLGFGGRGARPTRRRRQFRSFVFSVYRGLLAGKGHGKFALTRSPLPARPPAGPPS